MLLRYFYDRQLAHASYLVGCQKSGEAVVIDPSRSIDQYVETAKKEGLKITAAVETHIHADFVSGARELAHQLGARLMVSDAGPAEWKYEYLDQYDSQKLHDGDVFQIGKIEFKTVHTPGHTPESISLVLTDQGGGADRPMGIFTGDFVFVGSIGRPDLLEEAAGVEGSSLVGAQQLFESIQRFKELPDFLQVWPAHGAGSACGKGLGAIPSSTVGYEKLFNPALQIADQESFVEYILADQPPAPKYFANMKHVNKVGPALLHDADVKFPSAAEIKTAIVQGAKVIDTAAPEIFAKNHMPGAINIPKSMLSGWAGWILNHNDSLHVICDSSSVEEIRKSLCAIGLEKIEGFYFRDDESLRSIFQESYANVLPEEIQEAVNSNEVDVVDVRSKAEWESGIIHGAAHHFLGTLLDDLDQIPNEKRTLVHCLSGGRSAIAVSLMQSRGYDVVNLAGGIRAWTKAGFALEKAACQAGKSC